MENITLTISKLIGQPINESLPVAVAISEMADVYTAEPGEKVFYFAGRDDDSDEILDVAVDGEITVVKRNPVGDTELVFKGLDSKLEYVLVDAVLSSPDVNVLARKKAAIARGMDKLEVRLIIKAIMDSGDIATIAIPSGGDLYDVIQAAKHAVEDYGDNYLLMVGSAVKQKIDTYSKDKAGTHQYDVRIKDLLSDVTVKKMFGKVKYTGDSVAERIMDANKFILVARNSTVAEGKPLAFVRRKISADIAKLMGADVDKAQRALIVNPTPVQVAGVNVLSYGIFGYESLIFAVLNRKAVVRSADLVSIL